MSLTHASLTDEHIRIPMLLNFTCVIVGSASPSIFWSFNLFASSLSRPTTLSAHCSTCSTLQLRGPNFTSEKCVGQILNCTGSMTGGGRSSGRSLVDVHG